MYAYGLSTLTSKIIAIVLAVAAGVSCRSAAVSSGPQLIQPGAPGEASREISPDEAVDLSQVGHTPADVRFMQGMIGHHAQAIEMTDLLATRTGSEDMRKLALRIEVSQRDEIRMMQEWLQARGAEVPGEHAHHAHGATLMPGMLTPDEMSRLAAATGTEFDRLFLEFMMKHHDGALIMVRDLFATSGAGQESEIFAFASDVEADQQMEIDRMAAMLRQLRQ